MSFIPAIFISPTTIDQAFWLATQLLKSGLLGKAIQKPEAAFAVILAGRELGLTSMQSLRSLHLIEGKPTLSADLMAALCKRSPLCKAFRLVESTPTIATYEAERAGEGVTRMSFTMAEAIAAGVAGRDNWKKFPAAMLRARCIAAIARVVFPDLLLGVYEQDEIAAPTNDTPPPPSAPIPMRAVIVEAPPVPVDPAVVEIWTERFDHAADLAALDELRKACKSEVRDQETLLAIGNAFAKAQRALKGANGHAAANGQ